jgi:hypothetical protein
MKSLCACAALIVTGGQPSTTRAEFITYSLVPDQTKIQPGEFVSVSLYASFDPGVSQATTYKGEPATVIAWLVGSGHFQNFGRDGFWTGFVPAFGMKTTTGGSSYPFGLMGVTVWQDGYNIMANPVLLGHAKYKPDGTEPSEVAFQFITPKEFQSGMTVQVNSTKQYWPVEWDKTSSDPAVVQIVPAPGTVALIGVAGVLTRRRRR